MTAKNRSHALDDRRIAFLAACMPVAREAASCYTTRFNLRNDADDFASETSARVVSLIAAGKEPFDADPADDSARQRAERFVWGVAANVGREFIRRQRKASAIAAFDERAALCEGLELAPGESHKRTELNNSIAAALSALRAVTPEVRETLIVEEIRRNEYAPAESQRLCDGAGLSYDEVSQVVEQQRNGKWSPEAWRQRVKRARDKAREALAGRAAELGFVSLILAAAVSIGAAAMPAAPSNATTIALPAPTPLHTEINLADSTQNGNPKGGKGRAKNQFASTQNGNPKGGKGRLA